MAHGRRSAEMRQSEAIGNEFAARFGAKNCCCLCWLRQNGPTHVKRFIVNADIPETLLRGEMGRHNFAELLRTWLRRSGWSYSSFADLAEAAVTILEADRISRQIPGKKYRRGDIRIFNGHVWRALCDGSLTSLPRYRENGSKDQHWEHIARLRRIAASQVNSFAREAIIHASVEFFDTCGLLNIYIEGLKAGRYKAPADASLKEKAMEGIWIADEQTIFGAEEFTSVYLGNRKVPEMLQTVSDQEAIELSAAVAREIRAAITECGLDLVEDWPQFISAYPTTDPVRHGRIRDVALGLARWSAEQVQDERAAVAIAISRLKSRHSHKGQGSSRVHST